MFVLGFGALGLGALLLLLPPRAQSERRHGTPLRVVRRPAARGGRVAVALALGTARAGSSTLWAMERFAATSGRDGAVRIGVATFDRAGAVGRASSAAGSRGWSEVQVAAPRAWRGLVATADLLAREAHSASLRTWVRVRPVLRQAWAICVAGLMRAAHELAVLAHSASKRLSAYVESRTRSR